MIKILRLICSTLVMPQLIGLSVARVAAQSVVETGRASLSRRAGVGELSRQGSYYEALVEAEKTGGLSTINDKLAAAKSAWALGLVNKARTLWDEVFAERRFQDEGRERAMLARAILELQEKNYDAARSFAEQAADRLPPSELRAQLWLLIAESLREQGACSLAEKYYKQAIDEGDSSVSSEAHYLLGECQFRLGLFAEARKTFAALETESELTPLALRKLAMIDLQQRNYEGVLTWLEEGRESYPSQFDDGWTTYAMIVSFLELDQEMLANRELKRYRSRNSTDDNWVIIASATLEAKYAVDMNNQQNLAELDLEKQR